MRWQGERGAGGGRGKVAFILTAYVHCKLQYADEMMKGSNTFVKCECDAHLAGPAQRRCSAGLNNYSSTWSINRPSSLLKDRLENRRTDTARLGTGLPSA